MDWQKLLLRDFQERAPWLDPQVYNVTATNMNQGERIVLFHTEPEYVGSLLWFLERKIGVDSITIRYTPGNVSVGFKVGKLEADSGAMSSKVLALRWCCIVAQRNRETEHGAA